MLEDVDLERVVSISAADEESAVVTRGRAGSLKALAGFGISEHVLDDAADLGCALLGEPLLATVLRFDRCELSSEFSDLCECVVACFDGAECHRGKGGGGDEADGLSQTHSWNSPY